MLPGVLTNFMRRHGVLKNARWFLLAAGMAAVLGLLALLQYRANRQLRDVLEQQMRSDATTSLLRIRSGLEDEFASICNSLELTNPGSSETGLQQYAQQFSRWRISAVHPDLVSNVFIFQGAGSSHPQLLQLRTDQTQFQSAEWPPSFSGLKEDLENIGHNMGPGFLQRPPGQHPHPNDSRHEPHDDSPPWSIDENVPALVQPFPNRDSGLSFLILELNLKELAQNILSQLVKHEFATNGNLNYRIALINTSDHNIVLYSSDARFGTSLNPVLDAQLNVFGPPMPMAGSIVRRFEVSSADPWRRDTPQTITSTQMFQMHGHAGPLRIQRIRSGREGPGWILIARHRKGSVEAAADALYHRNLTIDFGVLLVLAAMIATIAISSRRAQRLAQLQMDFVAGVSHELRTPLTGIISSAQNIADGLVLSKERSIQYGKAILGQAKRLAELVEQILLFSATEHSPAYNFEWLDVSELVTASLEGTASQLRSAEIRVEENIQPNLPRVWGDFKTLTQCLQNLIVNAIKYGGSDRWIGIRASLNVQSENAQPGSAREIVIAIEDHGRGISADELQKVFDPFYRSPSVTADQIQGSGLGLTIVKKIAEAMGGRLTVQSELGKGSRFSVHLQAEKHPLDFAVSENPQADAADHR